MIITRDTTECSKADLRTDYGCLYCFYSIKLFNVWICTYGKVKAVETTGRAKN